MEEVTIELGGRVFKVRPLTFKQLRELESPLRKAQIASPLSEDDFDSAIDILTVALADADPSMNRDSVLGLRGSKPELQGAVNSILRLTGYLKEEARPGESEAGR